MLFRKAWLIAWFILIPGSIIALVNVSKTTCGYHTPILLSRALTTDPYRGVTLGFCLFAAVSSIYLNSILMTIGFFGFFSAFLVSMFETAATHDALIILSALIIMYECRPIESILWKVHWWGTVLAGWVTSGWFLYIIFGCRPVTYISGPLPPSVECARCSWWFLSEYICFWSMFMLVYWKIDPKLEWHDTIIQDKVLQLRGQDIQEKKQDQEKKQGQEKGSIYF